MVQNYMILSLKRRNSQIHAKHIIAQVQRSHLICENLRSFAFQ